MKDINEIKIRISKLKVYIHIMPQQKESRDLAQEVSMNFRDKELNPTGIQAEENGLWWWKV